MVQAQRRMHSWRDWSKVFESKVLLLLFGYGVTAVKY